MGRNVLSDIERHVVYLREGVQLVLEPSPMSKPRGPVNLDLSS